MPAQFHDHFSGHAPDYARHRPGYPSSLFSYMSGLTDAHDLAWDCGTGSGQAALGLTQYFTKVYATDPSQAQIDYAVKHPTITYTVATAESSGLNAKSVDLITVAQALHWFDHQAFYREVERVAKPGGVLVAWSYGLTRIHPDVEAVIEKFYNHTVGPYWSPQRRYIDERYQTLPFPFAEEKSPDFDMQASWDLDAVCDYLATWSATRRFRNQHGYDPIPELRQELEKHWGDAQLKRQISWPLYIRVGRIG